jgi:hypothetical protein
VKTLQNNVEEHARRKAQDTGVRRREGRQRSTTVGSHSEIPSVVRSDRNCTRFTIGKSQGEISTERGPSDLNIDKKSALKRETDLSRQIRAQGPITIGSKRTCTVFKVQGEVGVITICKIAMKSELSDQALIWTVNSSQYRGSGV